MILLSIDRVMTAKKGVVTVLSEDTPAKLTIDGSDVTGLDSDYVLAAGSVIISPDADYIAFTDGVFTEKTPASSTAVVG